MSGDGRPFEMHLFHCLSESACLSDGPASDIHARLKARIRGAGLSDRVRVNRAGCVDQCGHGPMLVVYPEGVWYAHLGLEDADTIFEEHVVGGRPVERLRYRAPRPGKNRLPRRTASPGVVGPVDTEHAEWRRCNRCNRPS